MFSKYYWVTFVQLLKYLENENPYSIGVEHVCDKTRPE